MKSLSISILVLIFSASCSNIGDKMPEFELKTISGNTITKEELTGKVVVIDVWATWCVNCMNEINELNTLVEEYKEDQSIVFLAISDENLETVNRFLSKSAFLFEHAVNGSELSKVLQTRAVKTYPQHIILDPKMRIAYEHSGELSSPLATLSAEIDRIITNE